MWQPLVTMIHEDWEISIEHRIREANMRANFVAKYGVQHTELYLFRISALHWACSSTLMLLAWHFFGSSFAFCLFIQMFPKKKNPLIIFKKQKKSIGILKQFWLFILIFLDSTSVVILVLSKYIILINAFKFMQFLVEITNILLLKTFLLDSGKPMQF